MTMKMLTFLVILALLCKHMWATTEESRFVKVKEKAALEGLVPNHQQNVSSTTECLLIGQQWESYLIQTTDQNNGILCSLFLHYTEDTVSKMRPDNRSEVYQLDTKVEKDCLAWHRHGYVKSGIYRIGIEGSPVLRVSCDMENHGGGWIVFQRRFDGSVDFNQDWETYKRGFGNLEGVFWLGNDLIHLLSTRSPKTELLLYGKGFDGMEVYAQFEGFAVGDEGTGYKLTSGVAIAGRAHAAWLSHNGMRFSTRDVDNDAKSSGKCSEGDSTYFHSGFVLKIFS